MATTTSTEASLDQDFVSDFSHRWMEAWNRHDGEAVAALCTEDVEFTDPALGTVRGRAAVAKWVRACERGFPDLRFEEPEPALWADDRPKVIAPWLMLGTNSGPIDPPGLAPTGRSVRLEGVDHWWFRGDLVERYRADYDSQGLMRQLGLAPEPGSRSERAMVAVQRAGARLKRR